MVELAGFHAYQLKEDYNTIDVNYVQYRVVNIIHDPSGLDAMTVKNTLTNEYTIVYQGTQNENGIQDMLTNFQLLS
ncbi:hypothetical protein J9303_20870, partial [Bacillaceae bacterium Marseille-Q3522]|nr:hypothetical protein [Bacillaceae bacterium Marseille-Q3522]